MSIKGFSILFLFGTCICMVLCQRPLRRPMPRRPLPRLPDLPDFRDLPDFSDLPDLPDIPTSVEEQQRHQQHQQPAYTVHLPRESLQVEQVVVPESAAAAAMSGTPEAEVVESETSSAVAPDVVELSPASSSPAAPEEESRQVVEKGKNDQQTQELTSDDVVSDNQVIDEDNGIDDDDNDDNDDNVDDGNTVDQDLMQQQAAPLQPNSNAAEVQQQQNSVMEQSTIVQQQNNVVVQQQNSIEQQNSVDPVQPEVDDGGGGDDNDDNDDNNNVDNIENNAIDVGYSFGEGEEEGDFEDYDSDEEFEEDLDDVGPSMDLSLRLKNANNLDEFLNLLKTQDGRDVTMDDLYNTTDDTGKAVISGGGRMAEPDECSPRNTTVELEFPKEPANAMYFPQCTRIERCGGCVGASPHLECRPAYTERVSLKVVKAQALFPGSPYLTYSGFATVIVDRHVRCVIACNLDKDKCGPKKRFVQFSCECKCKRFRRCRAPRIWDASTCDCQCNRVEDCPEHMEFHKRMCRCVLSNRHAISVNETVFENARIALQDAPPPPPARAPGASSAAVTTTTRAPTTTTVDVCAGVECTRNSRKTVVNGVCRCVRTARRPANGGRGGQARIAVVQGTTGGNSRQTQGNTGGRTRQLQRARYTQSRRPPSRMAGRRGGRG